MNQYEVNWKIIVDANNPEEAAEIAREIQLGDYADHEFEVVDEDGVVTTVVVIDED